MIGSITSNPKPSQTRLKIAPTGRYNRLLRKLSSWYVTVQIPVSKERLDNDDGNKVVGYMASRVHYISLLTKSQNSPM